ncbi:fibronectin-binding autotransporter adhesin [Terrimicrobium sacchariphilum]|uniref:Fibronectin-binding autotransporter adhesin n=1 Tax=Terrimicrobium sacchariphilum TaxID=690879 RepID=A0A146GC55_TERSA|nr:autotransporter-associated beta strand repeat-containing protein [Terrimicrobium sacchariphilum]GAT34384.1 fibronectin-binding autotransporter adhesin [Terrimicrobium sacchariphilum]
MHLPTSSRFYVCGLLAFAALSSALRADSLTWDSSGLNPNAPVDGAGAWDTSTALWSNGSVDSIWDNAGNNTAVFGSSNGAAGTVTVGTITAGGITFNPATSGSYLLSGGTLTLGGSTPTITTNANAEIASAIAGTTGLTKEGSGVLTLSGTNTFTGGLKLNAGTVSFSVAGNLSSGAVTFGGGSLRFVGTTGYSAVSKSWVVGTSGAIFDLATSDKGYVAYSGTMTFTGSGARTITLSGSSTSSNTSSASMVIGDGSGGATSLVKNGSASWNLSGANTYTGSTTVNQGILFINGDNRIPVASTVYIASGASIRLVNNQTFGNLQDGTGGGGYLTRAYSGGTSTATIQAGRFSGRIYDLGTDRYIAVAKTTSGLLRLSGTTNDYTGGTTISSGTLLINNTSGTGLGVGNVTVTNATLGGNGYSALGTAASHTIGSGGVIAPGDSEINGGIGTLTLNGANSTGAILDMQAGSSFSFNLGAGDANDTLRFYTYAGASDFLRDSGGVVLNFSGALAGTYDLFRFYSNAGTTLTDAGFTQATSNFTLGSGLTGYNATWDYSTLGVISLTLTAVPEPSSAVLFGLGGLCAMVLWRRARYRASVRG